MIKLQAHRSNPRSNSDICVTHKLRDKYLEVFFNVKTDIAPSISKDFSKEGFDNIGLWNFDVCEVFVRRGGSGAYIELEASPLGQKLALKITKPRIDVGPFEPKNTVISSSRTADGFKSHFKIAISDIPGRGNKIEGNYFCCLGNNDGRSYFAMNINNDTNADYHRPELFMRIN